MIKKDPVDALMADGPGEDEDPDDAGEPPAEAEVAGGEEIAMPEQPEMPERPAEEVMDDLQKNLDELRGSMARL